MVDFDLMRNNPMMSTTQSVSVDCRKPLYCLATTVLVLSKRVMKDPVMETHGSQQSVTMIAW